MTDFDPEKLKHKPNEKHTLDEVLKSLQDLIHNDLLRDPGQPTAVPDPAAGAEAPPAAEIPPADPAAPGTNVPFDAMVASLEQLVTRELASGDDSRQGAVTDGQPAAEPAAEIPSSEPVPAPESAPAKRAETGQQMFAFDDSHAAEPDMPAAETPLEPQPAMDAPAAPSDEPEVEEITLDAGDLPVLNDPVLDTEPAPAPDVDGIPVLEDVALAPPPGDSMEGGGRAASGTAADDPTEAIVERVIARLNAERRARGEPELDAATGDTLRALLRDELAHRPPEK